MRFIKWLCIVFSLLVFINGCTKKNIDITDDSLYVIDKYQILILCELQEQPEYLEIARQLKGDSKQLEKVIEQLGNFENTPVIKNAFGVAYIRLRDFEKAKKIFESALEDDITEIQKVIILSNLAAVNSWLGLDKDAEKLLDMIKINIIDDEILELVLESNHIRSDLARTSSYIKEIRKVKKLLNKEIKFFGSNQFIGIFNYNTLAWACYDDDVYKECNQYLNKAIDINNQLYHYDYLEADLYAALAHVNSDYSNTIKDAIMYISKTIEILEKSFERNYYDTIKSYNIRGNLYMEIGRLDDAQADYNMALENWDEYDHFKAVCHYNLGWLYLKKSDYDLSIDHYISAYYIWDTLDIEQDKKNLIIQNAELIFFRKDLDSSDFQRWFNKKLVLEERKY